MAITTPTEVLVDQVKDLHSAQFQLARSFQELSAKASEPRLGQLLSDLAHLSEEHLCSLQSSAQGLGASAGGETCRAIEGLIEGGNKHIDEAETDLTRNLLLVAHTSRILHYLIGGFAFAHSLATELENADVAASLGDSLEAWQAGMRDLRDPAEQILSFVNPLP